MRTETLRESGFLYDLESMEMIVELEENDTVSYDESHSGIFLGTVEEAEQFGVIFNQ